MQDLDCQRFFVCLVPSSIWFSLYSEIQRLVLRHCCHAAGFLASILGCTRFSFVPIELDERVTSVTFADLVSNGISLSQWCRFTTFTNALSGMVSQETPATQPTIGEGVGVRSHRSGVAQIKKVPIAMSLERRAHSSEGSQRRRKPRLCCQDATSSASSSFKQLSQDREPRIRRVSGHDPWRTSIERALMHTATLGTRDGRRRKNTAPATKCTKSTPT